MDIEKYLSKLTPSERAYFIACTDIFHDEPYSVDGRPSMAKQLQNTVVLNTERNVTQADFSNVTPGANWDLNLVSLPWITSRTFVQAQDTGFNVNRTPITPTTYDMGGITMFAADSGNITYDPTSATMAPVMLNADNLLYPTAGNVIRPFYEILAMGYEVYNVTPDLYLGGSLVRYRVPTQARKANLQVFDQYTFPLNPPTFENVFATVIPPFPGTESLATQYPDSVIDEAKAGTYQQHCIQDSVSDFHAASNEVILIAPANLASTVDPNCLMTENTFLNTIDLPCLSGDFDIVGTYLSGLPPQTNLKIRARYIISSVPSSTSASLVSLAKMSPPDNPKLTQLVSYVQNKLPPGVSVKLNPKGEWWKVVGRIISKAAPVIGSVFGPEAAIVGTAVGKLAGDISKPSKKKAQSQPKSSPKQNPKPRAKAG